MRTPERQRRYEIEKRWRDENSEKVKSARKMWVAKNHDELLAKRREWYRNNPEKIAANRERSLDKNREKVRERNRRYRRENPEKVRAAWRKWANKPGNKEKEALSIKQFAIRMRNECFAAYGGKCFCCGESRPEFLTMHHVNGRTATAHPRDLSGYKFYAWLKKQGYPKGEYEPACFNCNCALGYLGYCPHERERLSEAAG
jgi:hypothetical protein